MSEQAPRWVADVFNDSLDHVEKLDQILHISMRGISMHKAVPNAIKALREYSTDVDESVYGEARLDRANQEAALAEAEVSDGFPLLHAQSAISLWTTLEALVRTFLANWLANEPGAKQIEPLKRVKIRYGEYEVLSDEDRNYYILDLLEESLSTRRKAGIGRFEVLFQAFCLSSEVNSGIQKNLFELYHVRNVLVHRQGIVDSKLTQACPWMGLSAKARLIVSHRDYRRHSETVGGYILELIQRVRVHHGLGRHEFDERTANSAAPAQATDAT